MSRLAHKSGQATAEYLVVATGVMIALVTLTVAGRAACINGFSGRLSEGVCETLPSTFDAVLQKTVQQITFLINLPF